MAPRGALRARQAGYNIIYVYAAHTYLLAQFADAELNRRADSYGGILENRWRLVRELIEETREAVGETCAVAIRIETDDERAGARTSAAPFLRLAPHLDLFNVTISDYSREMGVSRFVRKPLSNPLSPNQEHHRKTGGQRRPLHQPRDHARPRCAAASSISSARRRPSIADPFIPQKIREGRLDDIRECIGCNICYAGDAAGSAHPLHPEPHMGEEWRRGWHPENFGSRATRTCACRGGGA